MAKLYFIFLLFSLTAIAIGQSKDTTYKYWMTIGISAENYVGITFDADYSFSLGDYFYKVGYLSKGGIESGDMPYGGQWFFRSYNVSIGKRYMVRWFQASLFCGPSYVHIIKGNDFISDETFHTVGLAAQVQLLLKLPKKWE